MRVSSEMLYDRNNSLVRQVRDDQGQEEGPRRAGSKITFKALELGVYVHFLEDF